MPKKSKSYKGVKLPTANDPRTKKMKRTNPNAKKPEDKKKETEDEVILAPQANSSLFFTHNEELGPPYHIIVDTNFIKTAIANKIDLVAGAMDCLLAKCTIYITDCVMGEMEKLGRRFRLAVKIAKDPRFERLPCTHKGVYADDCLVQRCQQAKCWIIATGDRDLKRRLRKIPGVPIMYIHSHQFSIERMPEAWGAPKW
eukprot:TRINITY_DN13011_c0_g1_i1.p2 TRINITY_DN13011_c0_g1~~TRINITY_DN13011_c0_g1_i1.p2  ORF type:complete len:199 (+),score=40.24 TRINITY_DN13011_c0_g1_i1:277-873(+)